MPYLSAYPRAGQIALLCEGDLIGYEASLFQKWAGIELGTAPLVDIWPCGTATSIRGVSDAIGRSRPIFVIEDRDFRSADESREECARNRKDRERRGIKILGWSTWSRCEIENYLLEADVLFPVFREAFGCADDDIIIAVDEILPALALFQASQYAMSRARRLWLPADPAGALFSGLSSRPRWSDSTHRILPPEEGAFRTGLEQKNKAWVEQTGAIRYDPVGDFDAKFQLWKNCRWQDDFWRIDWAGKEILHWLRIAMTSKFGWPVNGDPGNRQTVSWEVSREKREAQDRPIEAALRPRMIDQFLAELTTLPREIRDEFDGIKTVLKSQ